MNTPANGEIRIMAIEEKTWIALLQEVAALSDALGLDSGDWSMADECTLKQELDPWRVIRAATKWASDWRGADLETLDDYVENLEMALKSALDDGFNWKTRAHNALATKKA